MIARFYQIIIKWRNSIRSQPWFAFIIYMVPNAFYALTYYGIKSVKNNRQGRVALCLRFRDEARFLSEWIDYHAAAGIDHFFLYNNFSTDNYEEVLQRYKERNLITLIDWPYTPASPSAENNCIRRTQGLFDWVGFIDADEFVVVDDGRSIPEFLNTFDHVPAVALHWYYYGSNGHRKRPQTGVIRAYTYRATNPNRHFKVFVRPEQVTRNRNSHNFYYHGARCAIREDGRRVYGSMASPACAQHAWINHYFCKSQEDYLEKARRRSTLDKSGIREPSRQEAFAEKILAQSNDIEDCCAVEYFEKRLFADIPN